MTKSVGARFVTDGAAELLERGQVALARQEQPSATVIPHGPHLLAAVAGLDLGQVVEAEQQLDSLAWPARGVSGKPRYAGEVGGLIECEQKAR